MGSNYDFDDDDKDAGGGPRAFKEFDCPDCNANNPVDDTFTDGDEVRCNYCGSEYKALVNSEGRVRFKEV